MQYEKIILIRRRFQTVFILYINKPTILQSIKLRIIEGKLKDAARKLSKGSVSSKVGCAFPMVISPELCIDSCSIRQYRDEDFTLSFQFVKINGVGLSDGHLARIPHGAVQSQRPSLPRTPV